MGKARQRQRTRTALQPSRAQPAVAEAAVPLSGAAGAGWKLGVCAAVLVVVTAVGFLPVLKADFIRWDDPDYVTENALLRDGSGFPGWLAAVPALGTVALLTAGEIGRAHV